MATRESDVQSRNRSGRRPRSRPLNDESNGLLKTLWADLRKKELPHADDPIEDAWYDEHQEARREYAAKIGRAHNVDPSRRDKWCRWYWNS